MKRKANQTYNADKQLLNTFIWTFTATEAKYILFVEGKGRKVTKTTCLFKIIESLDQKKVSTSSPPLGHTPIHNDMWETIHNLPEISFHALSWLQIPSSHTGVALWGGRMALLALPKQVHTEWILHGSQGGKRCTFNLRISMLPKASNHWYYNLSSSARCWRNIYTLKMYIFYSSFNLKRMLIE